jgi:hypothetical protein
MVRIRPLAAEAAPAPARPAAILFRTSFIHVDRAPAHLAAVQLSDGPVRFAVVAHLDEPKSPRLSGVAVSDQIHPFHVAIRRKQGPNLILTGPEVEVPYKYILHFRFLCGAATLNHASIASRAQFFRGSGWLWPQRENGSPSW